MGIDLYAKWDGVTEAEAEAQITGFSVTAGSVGYLREAYHGGPYVTAWLAPEAFVIDSGYESAATWIGKGSEFFTLSVARAVGGAASPKDVVDFPRLAASADGFPPEGYLVECEVASAPHPKYGEEEERVLIPTEILRRRLPLCEALNERRYPGDAEDVNESFRAFVEMYGRLEAEGRRPGIYVSY